MLTENLKNTVPEWADFFSAEQYEQFIQYVQDYFKGQSVSFSPDDGVILNADRAKYGSERMSLLNLAQFCRLQPPEEWESTVLHHFEGLKRATGYERDFSMKAHAFEFVKEYIGVRVYPAEYVDAIKDGLVIGKNITADIFAMLVFDFPNCVVNIRPEQTIQWGMTNEALFDLGLENIRKKYTMNISEQYLDGVSFHLVVEDHFYSPNILFSLGKILKFSGEHGVLVGVPNRHAVIIHPVKDHTVFQAIRRIIPAIAGMYKEGPGSISEKLYWLSNGEFIPLPYTLDPENISLDLPAGFGSLLASFNDKAG